MISATVRYSQRLALTLSAIMLLSGLALADPTEDETRTGQWCHTQIMFEKRQANGTALSPEACTQNGNCDSPAARDVHSPDPTTPIIYLRLYFHVMANDDGSYQATTAANVAQQVDVLNADYLPYRIQFEYDMRVVNDTRYRSLTEEYEFDAMKTLYALDPANQINIYVSSVNIDGEVYSFGHFPWAAGAQDYRGGVVMNRTQFYPYSPATLTHELGHNLGLYHTFRGVSETAQCGSCYESVLSIEPDLVGDFCSDTPPTPLSYSCGAPGGGDPCASGASWGATAPQNYMSYASSSCQTEFTPQQAGRIHCWVKDALGSWIIDFNLEATNNLGTPPLTVDFQGISDRTALSWDWDFGDGGTGTGETPSHEFTEPGFYTVAATIQTPQGPYSTTAPGLVGVIADTIRMEDASMVDGKVEVDVYVRNYIGLTSLYLPIGWEGDLDLKFDSASTVGLRSEPMTLYLQSIIHAWSQVAYYLVAAPGATLEPGSGPILRLYFSDEGGGATAQTPVRCEDFLDHLLSFDADIGSYLPVAEAGTVSNGCCEGIVGDANYDHGVEPTIGDISTMVDHLFINGNPLACYAEADANQSGGISPTTSDITIGDISAVVDYLFGSQTPLPDCL